MNAPLVVTALVNGAWQALLLCILVKLVLRFNKRLNAATLYVVWCVVLGASVLLPLANYRFAAAPRVFVAAPASTVAGPRASSQGTLRAMLTAAIAERSPSGSMAWLAAGSEKAIGFAVATLRDAPLILAVVLLGVCVMLTLLFADLLSLARARARVTPFKPAFDVPRLSQRRFSLVSSRDIAMPCVLGIWKPLLVVPDELADSGEANLRSVILHEQAHVARFDDWQNLLQRAISAVFFFNPAVHIAAREMALTREQACDDAAAAHVDDRWSYAAALSIVVTHSVFRNAVVPGMALRRNDIVRRIEALVDSACSHSVRINRRFAIAAALAMALVATAALRYQLPVVAQQTSAFTLTFTKQAACLLCERSTAVAALVKPSRPLHPPKPARPSSPRAPTRVSPPRRAERSVVRAVVATVNAPVAFAVARAVRVATAVAAPIAAASATAGAQPHRVDFLDTLQRCGLRNLSVDQLIALRDHGVDSSLIESAVQYGIRNLSVDSLVTLADHGVSADYLKNLARYGLRNLDANAIVALVDNDVSSRYAADMSQAFGALPTTAIVELANHDVSRQYVEAVARSGIRHLTIDQVIHLHDQGYDPASSSSGGQR